MKVKLLEVRDRNTFLPVLAVDLSPGDWKTDPIGQYEARRWLLRRCGYPCDGRPNIGLTPLRAEADPFTNDPYQWSGRWHRTMPIAHNYIIEHWEELKDGDVIDVEYVLGERSELKKSERVTEGGHAND